jgi:hypothetical protein
MDSVSSSSSLLCNTRKMARLAWTAFRNGGVILSTRRRQTIGECPLRAFQKAESSVRRAGKNVGQSRSELESVCPFTTFRLSSSVTHFLAVTVKRYLASPYMSPIIIVTMGVCMLYLGTKHVLTSLLDGNYPILLLRTAFYVTLLIARGSSFSKCMQLPKGFYAQSGQIRRAAASVSKAHGKFRACQAPFPRLILSPFVCVVRQPVRFRGSSIKAQGDERPILDFDLSIQGLSFLCGIRARRCGS